jgi:hypothetical protein
MATGTVNWLDDSIGNAAICANRSEKAARRTMRGTMLWFNEVKDSGSILTDEGERLAVPGSGFAGGVRPVGRCAKAVVSFEVTETGGERKADEVILVPDVSPRRARLHHRAAQR